MELNKGQKLVKMLELMTRRGGVRAQELMDRFALDARSLRRYLADLLVKRVRLGDTSPKEKSRYAGRFWLPRNFFALKERLHLRSRTNRPPIIGIVKRFDSVRISGQKENAFLCVPKDEGKHSPKVVNHRFAFFGIKMKKNFRIGLGSKEPPFSLEFGTEGAVIVNFTVEADDSAAVLTCHRLGCLL